MNYTRQIKIAKIIRLISLVGIMFLLNLLMVFKENHQIGFDVVCSYLMALLFLRIHLLSANAKYELQNGKYQKFHLSALLPSMFFSKQINNIIVSTRIILAGLISLISLMIFYGQTGFDAIGGYLMATALTGLLFIKMYDLYKETNFLILCIEIILEGLILLGPLMVFYAVFYGQA
ncbi:MULTISPECIES: hypothetical protein [Burkholderia cepacia complex]|uniref:hypothetical protein n=1 Tax=Burkholderia cepacia complex TaxID=87882 RepID=UPI00222EDF76|nr:MULTISPECIES: hypothetical protein [Burkholderia cepacia complex]MCW3498735.1 hypothetical protein [Burkholderia cenocepacia]MCW3506177.1 hypothetical protein [Burkholderia cenocepacia]MCW3513888.1 hypothetical protein [Burkholderia cenocepacia]MCW3529038.1 hypothetical protein [Burkholderia cenocepacia]MCW3544628.1 hypothetical protein [Burkholderia cenocepacia]